MKFLELRIRKLNKKLLFFFPIIMLLVFLDQGHYTYADGNDITITTLNVDGVAQQSKSIRILSNAPALVDTFEENNKIYYKWEVDIDINYFAYISGYYSIYGNLYIQMSYPSTSNVVRPVINYFNNTNNINVTETVFTYSNANRYIRLGMSILGLNREVQAYQWTNFGSLNMYIITENNVSPTLSFTQYTDSSINIWLGSSELDIVKRAIETSKTASDVAGILVQAQALNVNLSNLYARLGITNNTLNDISGYAYEIWNILNAQYPTSASEELSEAQDNLESINQDIINYSPPTVSDQQIITDGQSAYMSMQLEGDTDNLFWYLNWGVILSLVTLIFSLAIISYIIYGKYS